MKRPAVFFDRDNTLIVSDGYLGDPAGVVLVDGAADAVAKARQYGFKVVTVSNQSGVARGMFREADVQAVNARLDELLRSSNPNAVIERHEYCPYHPDATVEEFKHDSELRKPKPGMLLRAAKELNLDLARSWLIGDAPRDILAGKAAGCRTILFAAPEMPASPAAYERSDAVPEFIVKNLKEALDIIAREAFFKPAPAIGAKPAGPAPKEVPQTQEESPQTDEAAAALPPAARPGIAPTPVAGSAAQGSQTPEIRPQKPPFDTTKTDHLLERILLELQRNREVPGGDFSVSKLLAGAVQVVSLAAMMLGYWYRGDAQTVHVYLLFAIALQTLTIALLIMGRQR